MLRCTAVVALLMLAISVAAGCATAVSGRATVRERACISLREADEHFTYRGEPIHPNAVKEFEPWLSEAEPVMLSIDVDAAQSGQHYLTHVERIAGGFKAHGDPPAEGSETFWYREVGRSSSGVHVLETAYSGGGSGIFMDVLLIRFDYQKVLYEQTTRDRLVMRCVGVVTLGDRDDGKVTLKGDDLILGKSRYRDRPIVIHLSPGAP